MQKERLTEQFSNVLKSFQTTQRTAAEKERASLSRARASSGSGYVSTVDRQGSHRLEKYLNLEGFLEKPLKIKYALKSTGKPLKNLEKSLNSSIFCRT